MADSITPAAGSLHGGLSVVIAANGFSGQAADTSVAVAGEVCEVKLLFK